MKGDTRAISPAVTQALTIGISTILITGLLVGGSTFIDNREEDTVRKGLKDVGTGVSSELVRLDQYNKTGVSNNLVFTSEYPDRVGNEPYRIHVVPSSDGSTIYVNSSASEYWTAVRFENTTAVCESRGGGGQIAVVYLTSLSDPCMAVVKL